MKKSMNYIIRQQIFMQIHISENITVQIGLGQKIILLATYCRKYYTFNISYIFLWIFCQIFYKSTYNIV